MVLRYNPSHTRVGSYSRKRYAGALDLHEIRRKRKTEPVRRRAATTSLMRLSAAIEIRQMKAFPAERYDSGISRTRKIRIVVSWVCGSVEKSVKRRRG
jgi:hypothetical protein